MPSSDDYLQMADRADQAGDHEAARDLYLLSKSSSTNSPAPTQPRLGQPQYSGLPGAGIVEPLAQIGSGLAGQITGGLAGIGTWAGNQLGLTQRNPGDVVQQVQGAMTYQPRTVEGQQTSQALGYLPGKFAEGMNWLGEKTAELTGSPLAGSAVSAIPQTVAEVAGMRGASARLPVREIPPALTEGAAQGLKFAPAATGSIVGKTLESLAGASKTERLISKQNVPVVDNLARKEIGLPEASGEITTAELQAAKQPFIDTYNRVAAKPGFIPTDTTYQAELAKVAVRDQSAFQFNVPKDVKALKEDFAKVTSFTVDDAIKETQQLRYDGSRNIGSRDPATKRLGRAQIDISAILENQIDRHLQATDPTLIPDFRAARQGFAKVYSVENAVRGGHVDAGRLAAQLNAKVPLSGNLRIIANAQQRAERSLQPARKIRDAGPFSVFDAGFGVLAEATGGRLAKAALGTIVGRPLVRSALSSSLAQRLMLNPPERLTVPPGSGATFLTGEQEQR